MTEVIHILSPMSASWCGWLMLVLFLCAVFSEVMQPGVITQSPVTILARTDRTYKEAPANSIGQILIAVFRIGTIALSLCLGFYDGGDFRFTIFATVCGIVLTVLIAKMLCNILLDYTFQLSRRFMPVYEQYGDMVTICTCILYICSLVFVRIGTPTLCLWALGAVSLVFTVMCLYRMARIYIQSPTAILYVVLYFCTLEVLPFAVLVFSSSKIISSL